MSSKFKIEVGNLKENTTDYSNIKKEKCGEILITNNGIFEINCLLCDNVFKNIRNYARHILRSHFQCEANSTIDYLVEIEKKTDQDQEIKSENQQTLEDKSIIKNEDDSKEYNNFVNNQKIIEEIEVNNVESIDNIINEMEMNYSLFDSNTDNQVDSELDIDDDVPLSDLKKLQNSPKNIKNDDAEDDSSICSENFQPENIEFISHSIEIEDENKNSVKDIDNKNDKLENISEKFLDKTNCKNCGKEISKNKLRSHLCANDGSRYIHQCNHCLKLFVSKKTLNLHIKNLHTEEKPFVCEIDKCGKRYVSIFALRYHMKRHGDRPFICNICGTGFLYQSRLDQHMKQHINKLRKETGMETQNSIAIDNKHVNNPIIKEKRFKQPHMIKSKKEKKKKRIASKTICDTCGKELTKDHMRKHLRIHDNSRKTFKCDICTKVFISEKSLDYHVRNVHTNDKPFECTIEHCGKKFVDESSLKWHITRHTSPRNHKCHICDKAYFYRNRLEEHIKLYHVNGRIYGCDICGKRYFEQSTLNRHQIVHSGEKPFECDECPAKFSRRHTLARHKKSHTGIKDFTCKICGKQYALYNGIYSHMKGHGIKYSLAYEKGLTDGKSD